MNKQSYCKYNCIFYERCQGNIDTCVLRVFHEFFLTLTPSEAIVLKMRFGFTDGKCYSRTKISEKLNTTPDRIKQKEAKALRKLRHPSRSRKLRDYMGD